jgi:hypothetical protein
MEGVYDSSAVVPDAPSEPEFFARNVGISGRVPSYVLGEELQKEGVCWVLPDGLVHDDGPISIPTHMRVGELVGLVESTYGVVYDSESRLFRRPVATHDLDGPDAAGHATSSLRVELQRRQSFVLRVRFVRGTVSATYDTVGIGADGVEFAQSVIAGVRKPWINITTERDFYDATQSVQTGITVNTQRQVVPGGVVFSGMVGPLQHGDIRLVGELQVSSFTSGVDRAMVDSPIEVDGPTGRWLKLTRYHELGATLQGSFKGIGVKLGGDYDDVFVFVRVDRA